MNARKWLVGTLAGAALAWTTGVVAPARAQQRAASAVAATKPAALVNGESISMAELEKLVKQVGPMPVELPEEARKQMRRQALAMMIDDTLMNQFIKTKTPEVPKAEIDAKMAEMEADLRKQKKTIEAFCKESEQTVEQLREGLSHLLRWQAWARSVIKDADLQKYYQDNKDFFDGVTVRASHIALRVPPSAPDTDKAKAQARLVEVRNQVLAGKITFEAAAKTYSQCPSMEQGGDLGFLSRKWMVEEPFAQAAFAMKPGQISDVVQTEYGLHIIKVTERKPGTPSDFTKIKDQVQYFYTKELELAVLAQQRKAAKIEVNIP